MSQIAQLKSTRRVITKKSHMMSSPFQRLFLMRRRLRSERRRFRRFTRRRSRRPRMSRWL